MDKHASSLVGLPDVSSILTGSGFGEVVELGKALIRGMPRLEEGQNATVLQLPAVPKTEKEADEQKRAEYVG